MTLTAERVLDLLRPVEDPELHRSIVDLGMVRDVDVSGDGRVSLTVVLTIAGCPLRNEIQNRVNTALAPEAREVALNFGVMNDEERAKVRQLLGNGGGAAPGQVHGHAQGKAIPFAQPGSKTRPILVSSGKDGMGKSSVTTNLAVALAAQGYKV